MPGGSGFAAGEEGDGFGAEDGAASVQQGVSEAGQVFRCGEEAGVSGDAAQDAGVFVLDFALDDSLAEGGAGGFAEARHLFGYWLFAGGGARATFRF